MDDDLLRIIESANTAARPARKDDADGDVLLVGFHFFYLGQTADGTVAKVASGPAGSPDKIVIDADMFSLYLNEMQQRTAGNSVDNTFDPLSVGWWIGVTEAGVPIHIRVAPVASDG